MQQTFRCAMQRDVPGLTRAVIPIITDEDWMRGIKVRGLLVTSKVHIAVELIFKMSA